MSAPDSPDPSARGPTVKPAGFAAGAGRFVRDAWSKRPGWLFTPVSLLTAALLIVVALWFRDFLGERSTLGQIVIGSPAIYTRERLVNDRLLQDAWLTDQLALSVVQDTRSILDDRRGATVRMGESGAPGGSPDARAPGQPGRDPRLSSAAQFLRVLDYRDLVRSQMIENQLDDRHDLYGNSLYRFQFETSVLPGPNTQASARITVRLNGPAFLSPSAQAPAGDQGKKPPDVLPEPSGRASDAWRDVYARWIENLSTRLNQTHTELKQGYRNNEFSGRDYEYLAAFLSRNLLIDRRQVDACSKVGPAQRPGARLSLSEHVARKRCVDAIVDKAVPKDVFSIDTPLRPGVYIRDAARMRSDDTGRIRRVHDVGDAYLNAFFAIRTVKLVLGLSLPERNFILQGTPQKDVRIPAFQKLIRLTAFTPRSEAADEQPVFEVAERTVFVAAVDKSMENELPQIIIKADVLLADHKPTDFIPMNLTAAGGAASRTLLVSGRHLSDLADDNFDLTKADFQDAGGGILQARIAIGLFNFVNAARRNVRAFTYGVTPKESADTVDAIRTADAQARGSAGAKDGGGPSVELRRQAVLRTLEERKGVVGFTGVSKDPLAAEFGWFLYPRQLGFEGVRPAYLHVPAQRSLSALVSIPSWWNQVRLQVTASWLGDRGQVLSETTWPEYEVDIPADFEPLEPVLLGIEQLGPELAESRLDEVALTACRPGAIVIPGRRLWRSTKVTMGYQTAEAISVLPNMKGIVAHFKVVENQMSREEERSMQRNGTREIQRTVRVWTSQGALTLPLPATIGVPVDASADKECAALLKDRDARAAAPAK